MEQNNRDDGGSSNKPPAPNNPGHQTSDEPPSGQPTMPTLESLASEPGRTHRTWIPKYGRIAKCDWCNNRGPGILMVCAHRRCSKYMCERCARSSTWHADPWHHIDADALDWTVKKIPRKTKTNRGVKRQRSEDSSPQDSPAGPGEAPSTSTPRRRLGMAAPRVDTDEDGDDLPDPQHHRAQFAAPSSNAPHGIGRHWAPPPPTPPPPPAAPAFYGYNPAAPFPHQPPAPSSYAQQGGMDFALRPQYPSSPAFAAPAAHPVAQQADPYGSYGNYPQQGAMGAALHYHAHPYPPAPAIPNPHPIARQDAAFSSYARQGGMHAAARSDYAQQSETEPALRPQFAPPSSALPAPATRPAARPTSASNSYPQQGEIHPNPSSPATPAPTRPAVRQAAARAIVGMSAQARQSSHSQGDNGNDDGSEYRDDGEDEDDEEDTVYNIKGDRYRKKGAVKKVNNRGRRGNRVPGNAGVRTATRERTSRSNTPYPPEAGSFAPRASVEQGPPPASRPPVAQLPRAAPAPAPAPEHGTHDHVVLDIYEFLYRQRPNLDPRRVRSQIPERPADQWSPPLHLFAPAPGYPHRLPESPRNLQDYASPGPATAAAPYAPTSRTTPAYHPLNDRTPAEVEAFHQDNTLQQQMQYAWSAHPTLHGLRQDGRRLDAIGLLWDVFELRRARVWVPDNSRTVAWFVAERDSQFRIEHSARALTAAHQFSGYPGPGEAAGTVGHRHRLALGPARRGVEEDEEEEYR